MLVVKCQHGCKAIKYLKVTDKYDPDVPARGNMVELQEPYKSWGWATFGAAGESTECTLASDMECPGCGSQLAPSGRLTVVDDKDPVKLKRSVG